MMTMHGYAYAFSFWSFYCIIQISIQYLYFFFITTVVHIIWVLWVASARTRPCWLWRLGYPPSHETSRAAPVRASRSTLDWPPWPPAAPHFTTNNKFRSTTQLSQLVFDLLLEVISSSSQGASTSITFFQFHVHHLLFFLKSFYRLRQQRGTALVDRVETWG